MTSSRIRRLFASDVYGVLMKKVAFFIWTAGFTGLVPVASGTAGSIVGLGLLMLVRTSKRLDGAFGFANRGDCRDMVG